MILSSSYWYDVVPADPERLNPIVGKWLYFEETNQLHSRLHDIDILVEAGLIRAAKIARKSPDVDLFPEKPCVLCVYTSSSTEEKERVKILLKSRLGITVTIWKSEAQTERDWEEDGILRIQASITSIRRDIESGRVKDVQAAQKEILTLTERLHRALKAIREPDRMAELFLTSIHTLQKGLETTAVEPAPDASSVLERLITLEAVTNKILSSLEEKRSETLTPQQTERARLRRNLHDFFSDTDLREICFDLGIDYQDLSHEDKRVFVVEIIVYMERRGQLQELVEMVRRMRPNIAF